jgi:hypothetical protein
MCIALVKADTVVTTDNFNLDFQTNQSFIYQDTVNAINIIFTVSDGNLTGSGALNTLDTGGSLTIYPTDTGTITFSASNSNYTLYLNGAKYGPSNIISYSTGNSFTISWDYPFISPVGPHYPNIINVAPFWQYLFSGNFLGFFQAIYLSAFGLTDILYGAISMLLLVPIYIRTKSLWLLCVLWILLGSFAITLMPAASPIAIIFLILGVAGILWRLVHPN